MSRTHSSALLISLAGGVLGGAVVTAALARRKPRYPDWTPLRPLVHALVGEHECVHLRKLSSGQPFPFLRDGTTGFFEAELRRLRSLRFVEELPARSVDTLLSEGGDVRDHLFVTPLGRQYLALRELVDNEPFPSH